ncbi:MAG TPA: galactose-1-phosphate uridylyltransferase [Mycobacteriales bacterium]
MSERRYDPTAAEWVTFASHRQDRTFQPAAEHCPLCPQRPGGPPTEVGPEPFDMAVFDNRFPSYQPNPPDPDVAGDDLLQVRRSYGRCEVVVYTPDHEGSLAGLGTAGARTLVDVWTDRSRILGADPAVAYVLPFENRGATVGVTLPHPHGQIYAYPEIPPRPARELAAAATHYRATGRCVHCDVREREESLGLRVVARADGWVASVPFWARFPYELQLLARRHRPSLDGLEDAERDGLADLLVRVLGGYDRLFGFPLPYVLGVYQAPTDGGRWDPVSHLRVSICPPHRAADRLKYLAGSELLAGAFLTDVAPEAAAATLRAVVET